MEIFIKSNSNTIKVDFNFKVIIVLIVMTLTVTCCEFQNNEDITKKEFVGAVSNVVVQDVGNSGNPSDLKVSFDSAPNENEIASYQIFIVQTDEFVGFSIDHIISQGLEPAEIILTSGLNNDIRLAESTLDISGNALEPDESYFLYILSVSTDQSKGNSLSLNSNIFSYSDFTSPVTDICIKDIGNSNSHQDIYIEFSEPINRSAISGYKLLITENSFLLNQGLASNAPDSTFLYLEPGQLNYNIQIPETLKNIDGSIIRENQGYSVYLLSIADGVGANQNTLSEAVNFTIENTKYVQTISSQFEGNGGIVVAYKVFVYNLGSLSNPNGSGVKLIDPESGDINILLTPFSGATGGSAWGNGSYICTANRQIYFLDEQNRYDLFFSGPPLTLTTDLEVRSFTRFVADCSGIYTVAEGPTGFIELRDLYPKSELLTCPINLEFGYQNSAFIVNNRSKEIIYTGEFGMENAEFIELLTLPETIASITFSKSRNKLYAATEDGYIYEINYLSRTFEKVAGGPKIQDGVAELAGITRPYSIAVDEARNCLYFTDLSTQPASNGRVVLRKLGFERN
ncbi:MAG: hypothetical protein NXI20_08555 [bacterium]|nr:hypothetical protein [bacterium]